MLHHYGLGLGLNQEGLFLLVPGQHSQNCLVCTHQDITHPLFTVENQLILLLFTTLLFLFYPGYRIYMTPLCAVGFICALPLPLSLHHFAEEIMAVWIIQTLFSLLPNCTPHLMSLTIAHLPSGTTICIQCRTKRRIRPNVNMRRPNYTSCSWLQQSLKESIELVTLNDKM